jgi:phenylpyruvate tautomerase PptA (4-oxalocrotonate tautomerase family)
MPVVHIYTAEGWLSPARKRLMVEKVTDAVVAAEGLPAVRDMTYVLIHEVPDGGWSFKDKVALKKDFAGKVPLDPPPVEA